MNCHSPLKVSPNKRVWNCGWEMFLDFLTDHKRSSLKTFSNWCVPLGVNLGKGEREREGGGGAFLTAPIFSHHFHSSPPSFLLFFSVHQFGRCAFNRASDRQVEWLLAHLPRDVRQTVVTGQDGRQAVLRISDLQNLRSDACSGEQPPVSGERMNGKHDFRCTFFSHLKCCWDTLLCGDVFNKTSSAHCWWCRWQCACGPTHGHRQTHSSTFLTSLWHSLAHHLPLPFGHD